MFINVTDTTLLPFKPYMIAILKISNYPLIPTVAGQHKLDCEKKKKGQGWVYLEGEGGGEAMGGVRGKYDHVILYETLKELIRNIF